MADWSKKYVEKLATVSVFIGMIYTFVGSPLLLFTVLEEHLQYAAIMHTILFAVFGGVLIRKYIYQLDIRNIVIVLQMISFAFLAHFSFYEIKSSDVQLHNVNTAFFLFGVLAAIIFTCPIKSKDRRLAAYGYYAMLAFGAMYHALHPLAAYTSSVAVFATIIGMRIMVYNHFKTQALLGFRAEHNAKYAEREKIRQELLLAKNIQDSLAVPDDSIVGGKFIISTFQKKHAQVGGDWVAMRSLPSGENIVLVADATGKGLQAALVIHAVQSLWADSLSEDHFCPEAWIKRVNLMLLRLGETTTHSVTLGILKFDEKKITYWSAGHPPAYLVTEEDGQPVIQSILGLGSILGINEEIIVSPVTQEFDHTKNFNLMFGSDGLFAKGTTSSAHNIIKLLDRVQKFKAEALNLYKIEDDKTLVWVRHYSHASKKGAIVA